MTRRHATTISRSAQLSYAGTVLMLIAIDMGSSPVLAQDPTRYTIEETADGGFVRLDQQTGGIVKCTGKNGSWSCLAVNDDSDTLRQDNDALRAENKQLKERLAVLEKRDPADDLLAPGQKQLDRVMSFFEEMVRRLFNFTRSLQDKPGESI